MSSAVEERLRRALAQQAATTTTSPYGWRRVRAAIDGGGGRVRRQASPRWTLLAPAAAVVAIVVVLAALVDRGGEGTLHVAGQAGRLHLAPTGVEPRFHLDRASDGLEGSPGSPSTFRAFGRRASGGSAVEASVVITMPGDRALVWTTPEPAPLRALGRDVALAGDPFGQRNLSWTQADGRTVGVMTFGLSQGELVAVAESLLAGDAATAVPALPVGFDPIKSGSDSGSPPMTLQSWEAAGGDRFSMAVGEGPYAGVDDLAWWLPGGRALKVRDTTAVYLAALEEAFLVWVERPGTVVTMQASGLSEQELVAIADGLRPISDAEWVELTTRVPPVPALAVSGPTIGPWPGPVPLEHSTPGPRPGG